MLVVQENCKLRSYGLALRCDCLLKQMILHLLRQIAPYPNNSLAQSARKLLYNDAGSWIGGWHFCYSRRHTPTALATIDELHTACSSALLMASKLASNRI
jgi:hypothetical protein